MRREIAHLRTMALRGLAAILVVISIASCQTASKGKPGKIVECELLGGTVVKQPPGSGITACCYENGCWICDEKGDDCVFDPAYGSNFWKGKFKGM